MTEPREIRIDRWPLVLLVLAFIAMLALAIAGEKLLAGLALGIGLVALGELINHPREVSLYRHLKMIDYPRRPRFVGTLLDIIGAAVAGLFITRLIE